MPAMKMLPTISHIRRKLIHDRRWVERGILAIHRFQTQDEQSADATLQDNGVGFNGADAKFLSRMARRIIKCQSKWGRGTYAGDRLKEWQYRESHKRMPKYAAQLHKIASGKAVTSP